MKLNLIPIWLKKRPYLFGHFGNLIALFGIIGNVPTYIWLVSLLSFNALMFLYDRKLPENKNRDKRERERGNEAKR